MPPAAQAVLILSADGSGNTTAPADDPGWANVGVRGGGNSVYLGDRWVLTVAHVGAGSIVLAGTTYAAERGSAVQLTNAGAGGRSTTTDLVLYRLATEPGGLAPVTIAATQPAVGTAVTLIGSGRARGPSPSGASTSPSRPGFGPRSAPGEISSATTGLSRDSPRPGNYPVDCLFLLT